MPPVTSTPGPAHQKLLEQATRLAQDGKLSAKDVGELLAAVSSDQKMSNAERAALKDIATRFKDQMESPAEAARLTAFARATTASVRNAVRAAEKDDGFVDGTEARGLAEQLLQKGPLGSGTKTTLRAMMVASKMTDDAKAIFNAVLSGQPLPPEANYSPATLRETLLKNIQDRAYGVYSITGHTTTYTPAPLGDPFPVGDGMARRYSTNGVGEYLVLVNAAGKATYIQQPMLDAVMSRPPEAKGRTVLEMLGTVPNMVTGGNSWTRGTQRDFACEFGTVHFRQADFDGNRWKAEFTLNNPDARLQQLANTVGSHLPTVEAARILRDNFSSVAHAVGDTQQKVISRKDLEMVAVDPLRPVNVRSAAASLLGGPGLVEVDTAGEKPFADNRITLGDLEAALLPRAGLRTRAPVLQGAWDMGYGNNTRELHMRAVPGATLTIYSRNEIENGAPKKLATITAPVTGEVGADGLVSVRTQLPASVRDWDRIAVTQTAGTRTASAPVEVSVSTSTYGSGGREGTIQPDLIAVDANGVVSSKGDYSVQPFAHAEFIHNGVPTGIFLDADSYGRLDGKIPGNPADGTWELQVDRKVKGAIVGPPVDSTALAGTMQAALRNALLSPPDANGVFSATITGLAPGYAVTLSNPSHGTAETTFTADASGKLTLRMENTTPGDLLKLKRPMLDLSVGARLMPADITVAVPNAAQAQRARAVLDAVGPGLNERDRFLALELLGPYSKLDVLKSITDPAAMRDAFQVARAASLVATGRVPTAWKDAMVAQLTAAGKTDALAIFNAVAGNRGLHLPTNIADGGLTLVRDGAWVNREVRYGQWERQHDPSDWKLEWLGLPALNLRGNWSDSGYVIPNDKANTFFMTP